MGKKQHQSDKLYLTATEWKTYYGGKKDKTQSKEFRRLPFSCCSLSLQPFEHPYCTKDGTIFDIMTIVPFLKKFGIHPVTGQKLSTKELTKLIFHKNSEGKYHCPITFKVFNETAHIVAVSTSGNVFSYEAIEKLNIKTRNWKDLVSETPFVRDDLITIQDPTQLQKFNISDFHHLKKNLKVKDKEEELARKKPTYHLKNVNAETADILKELGSSYTPAEKSAEKKKKADQVNSAHYSTGAVAASFTSTATDRTTTQEAAIIDESVLKYDRVKKGAKKKAYIRLTTSHGQLNLELHCDLAPRTCENFILLCQRGYYNGTTFHRSIKNFMIQGGDPEGTGKGGQSAWGEPFPDELRTNLSHSGRGILSMANSGPNTNKSQFFITYRSAPHLNGKHTVFGKVVGGVSTIDAMEAVSVNKKDKPKEPITLDTAQVFVNPFQEAEEQLEKEREDALTKAKEEAAASAAAALSRKRPAESSAPKIFSKGVGKYINSRSVTSDSTGSLTGEPSKKKVKSKSSLQDFSSWD